MQISEMLSDKFKKIKLFLTDCDGCLTDGGMYYSENGDELKKFCALDGMGIRLMRENGILVGVVTGEDRELNRRRAKKLKLDIAEHGCKDKARIVARICKEKGIDLSELCYMGDDVNDLEAMKLAGLKVCPVNARPEIKAIADYITETHGGEGAVREVADMILACKSE